MPDIRLLNRKKYEISKSSFRTAYNYCLQYNEWKEALTIKRDTAMQMPEIAKKIEKVENAVMETIGNEKELHPYLLYYVTTEGCTFKEMKARGIPCERTYFYEMRRRFYSIIARRIV